MASFDAPVTVGFETQDLAGSWGAPLLSGGSAFRGRAFTGCPARQVCAKLQYPAREWRTSDMTQESNRRDRSARLARHQRCRRQAADHVDLQMEQVMPDPDPKSFCPLISQTRPSGSLLRSSTHRFFGLANPVFPRFSQAVNLLAATVDFQYRQRPVDPG